MNPQPWLDEIDYDEWADPDTGYLCRILRHPTLMHLCGYVQVPPGHPWDGCDYADLAVDVHGGITWTDRTLPGNSTAVDGWVVGFDCAHLGDWSPGERRDPGGEVYRTVDFVRGQCTALAAAAGEAAR